MLKRILFITSDTKMIGRIRNYFVKSKIDLRFMTHNQQIHKACLHYRLDLVVIDNTSKEIEGINLCHQLRKQQVDTPILMILAADSEYVVISALNAGADFYMFKPLKLQLLRSQILAALKRVPKKKDDELLLNDFKISVEQQLVLREKRELYLRSREFNILLMLAENKGKIVNRERINSATAGFRDSSNKSIDVHICNLRKKLLDFGCRVQITTVRGKGYRLTV